MEQEGRDSSPPPPPPPPPSLPFTITFRKQKEGCKGRRKRVRANRDKESKKRLITSRSLYYILSKALSFYFIGLGFRCINSAFKKVNGRER